MDSSLVITELKAGANVSGYVYLYLPKHLCKTFSVEKGTVFQATFHDGQLVILQKKE